MGETLIEWADHSVNPIRARNLETGAVGHFCERTSPGCAACYAATWNRRVRPSGKHLIGTGLDYVPANRAKVETFLDHSKLDEVLRRRIPTRFFWCDMTDLFGEWVPDAMIDRCFAVMALTPHHTHLVLTKRAERLRQYLTGWGKTNLAYRLMDAVNEFLGGNVGNGDIRVARGKVNAGPLPNVWIGVSVENKHFADERIPLLLQTPAAIRFISAEPLLEGVDLLLQPRRRCYHDVLRGFIDNEYPDQPRQPTPALDWVIVGGESGPGARPFEIDWARSILRQCKDAGVAAFMKQVGSRPSGWWTNAHGPMFNRHAIKDQKGGDPAEWPQDLNVREFPTVKGAT